MGPPAAVLWSNTLSQGWTVFFSILTIQDVFIGDPLQKTKKRQSGEKPRARQKVRNGGRQQLFDTEAFINSAAGESACDEMIADDGRTTKVGI